MSQTAIEGIVTLGENERRQVKKRSDHCWKEWIAAWTSSQKSPYGIMKRKNMNKNIAVLGIIIGALSLTTQAKATVVYSEDFNNPGFRGSQLDLSQDPLGNVTERWGTDSAYYNINNFDGWTFGSLGTYLAVQPSTGNQGVLLNENGGTATTVVGLTANAFYTLSFNYSGDNRPTTLFGSGSVYGLSVDVNSDNVVSLTGSWATTDPLGHVETVTVQANATGQVALDFFQTTPNGSQSSPIIDDVTLSTVPEPTTVVAGAMLLLPFGMSTLRMLRKNRTA